MNNYTRKFILKSDTISRSFGVSLVAGLNLFFLFFFFFFLQTIQAQERRPMLERVEAQRVAHITAALGLDSKESQSFWPIYNEYTGKERVIRRQMAVYMDKSQTQISESEAKDLLQSMIKLEREQTELKIEYYNRLLKVISAQKLVLLPAAELSFREKVIRRISERPAGGGRGRQ
jgi:hypothetical protein